MSIYNVTIGNARQAHRNSSLEKKIVTFSLTNFTENYISWTSDGLSEPESEIVRENMFIFLYTVKLHALKGQTYRGKI